MRYTLLSGLFYAALFALIYFGALHGASEKKIGRKDGKRARTFYAAALSLIFIFQLALAQTTEGYPNDFSCFSSWMNFGAERPVWEYYKTEGFYVDYPPVYLYLLYLWGFVTRFFGLASGDAAYLSFLKFFPILFDALVSLLIFKLAEKKLGDEKAAALAALSALNPANILNSTIWGQVDSIVTALALGLLLCLFHRKYIWAAAIFALAFLTKPQTVVFAPLVFFVFLFDLLKTEKGAERKKLFWRMARAVLVFGAMFLVVPLPITGGNYLLLAKKYGAGFLLYPYASLNAANLFAGIGANFKRDSETFFFLSYKLWGYGFVAFFTAWLGAAVWKMKERDQIFWFGAFTAAFVYLFTHSIHERYLYPALAPLLLVYIYREKRTLLWLYFAFSMVFFVNEAYVLLSAMADKPFLDAADPLLVALSWLNIAIFAVFWIVGRKMYGPRLEKARVISTFTYKAPDKKKIVGRQAFRYQTLAPKAAFTKKDFCLCAALTLVYAGAAFYNLGSLNAPQSGYLFERSGESVSFDFGEKTEIDRMYVHVGWMDRRRADQEVKRELRLEHSDDGEGWAEYSGNPLQIKDVFKWFHFDLKLNARYLRFSTDEGNYYINETGFFGAAETDRLTPKLYGADAGRQAALLDEQNRVVYRYTWFDEAYFDEIYHPRTAFEYLTGRYPFENTHPPLGKLFISLGMMLFGATPFGWRFCGTLCGVLMVPAAYLFGKRLFGKTLYAFIAAFLYAFDFMHLAQTRLATIDSYTALFAMLMFYFMARYLQMSFYTVKFRKTLLPLFLSGLCFGLGAATKWQGIYAGFGLLALFAISLARRYSEYRRAKEKNGGIEAEIRRVFRRRFWSTLGFAFLFFVAIPAGIYFASYLPIVLPALANGSKEGWGYIWSNQFSMYNYHSQLTATHDYGSVWWQWPLNLKPLYAWSPESAFLPAGTAAGITSFGNPLVWWASVPAIFYALFRALKRREAYDDTLLVVLIGFFALYAPWILVPRQAFIYHYFPCVIFVVLAIVCAVRDLLEAQKIKPRHVYCYLGAVLVLFVVFYPALTGAAVPAWYYDGLRPALFPPKL
jgi:Gpi18-like mannosyltransferase